MARRWPVLLCAAPAVLAVATGCAPRMSPLPEPSAASNPPPSTLAAPPQPPPPPLTLPTVPAPSGSTAAFAENAAVACAGRPGADRVVALLRGRQIIGGTATVTAELGPLCAGTWQYTVLGVPGREALQVVTKGPPTGLVLVTAGTDVCTNEVRVQAPPGIVTAAHCQ
jgi:hypothetical protein